MVALLSKQMSEAIEANVEKCFWRFLVWVNQPIQACVLTVTLLIYNSRTIEIHLNLAKLLFMSL